MVPGLDEPAAKRPRPDAAAADAQPVKVISQATREAVLAGVPGARRVSLGQALDRACGGGAGGAGAGDGGGAGGAGAGAGGGDGGGAGDAGAGGRGGGGASGAGGAGAGAGDGGGGAGGDAESDLHELVRVCALAVQDSLAETSKLRIDVATLQKALADCRVALNAADPIDGDDDAARRTSAIAKLAHIVRTGLLKYHQQLRTDSAVAMDFSELVQYHHDTWMDNVSKANDGCAAGAYTRSLFSST